MFNSTMNRVALLVVVIVAILTVFGVVTDGTGEVASATANAVANIK